MGYIYLRLIFAAIRILSRWAMPKRMTREQIEATLFVLQGERAARGGEKLEWRHSIIDFLKLLGMDSSLDFRRRLAEELGFEGRSFDGTAEQNVWLHQKVLEKIAAGELELPEPPADKPKDEDRG